MHTLRVCLLAAVCGIGFAHAAAAAPDGTQGVALMSAVVDGDGTLVRGNGTESAVRTVVGNYDLEFQRSIAACTWTVGVGGTAPDSPIVFGFAYGAPSDANNRTLLVQTRGLGGQLEDNPFHIIVFCAR